MQTTIRIRSGERAAYFDSYTKRFLQDNSPELMDLEATSLKLGDQFVADGALLAGIAYEGETRTLELAFDTGEHRIYEPKEVWVVEEADGSLISIEIVDREGGAEVVEIRPAGPRRSKE